MASARGGCRPGVAARALPPKKITAWKRIRTLGERIRTHVRSRAFVRAVVVRWGLRRRAGACAEGGRRAVGAPRGRWQGVAEGARVAPAHGAVTANLSQCSDAADRLRRSGWRAFCFESKGKRAVNTPDFRTASEDELRLWVAHLIENEIEEGWTLDYKSSVNIETTAGKRELARDISGFANSAGGILLIGVNENKQAGHPGRPLLEPLGVLRMPGFNQRVQDIVADAVVPRLTGLSTREIPLSSGLAIYVVAVEDSWCGPHMVGAYDDYRFHFRTQLRVDPMPEHLVAARYAARVASESRLADAVDNPEIALLERDHLNPLGLRVALVPLRLSPGTITVNSEAERQELQSLTHVWERGLALSISPYGLHSRVPDGNGPADGYVRIYESGVVVRWSPAEEYQPKADGPYFLNVVTLAKEVCNSVRFLVRLKRVRPSTPALYRISVRLRTPHADLRFEGRGNFRPEVRPVQLDSHFGIALTEDIDLASTNAVSATKSILLKLGRYVGLLDMDSWIEESDGSVVLNVGGVGGGRYALDQ